MNTIPIRIAISEPWDLGEAISWHEQLGTLIRVENTGSREVGLISLTAKLSYKDQKWPFLLVCPRSDRMNLSAAGAGASVPCNFVGLVHEPVGTALSDVLDDWRGGLAFIGDLMHADR
jgi:hypothetical protein